jgi:hypothetical protein
LIFKERGKPLTQEYICTVCCYAGAVVVREHAGPYEVIDAIDADHSANSPRCAAVIRVRNPERCTPEEWESLKLNIRAGRELRKGL